MNDVPVFIVGAGPTGLFMACELRRRGISVRIIDKKAELTQGSNATWIQTRTLEVLDAIGLIDTFLKIGHKCEAINLYANGNIITTLPLSGIDSSFPFILMLPQSETEYLLTKKLEEYATFIERSVELLDVKKTSTGVQSTIRQANGEVKTLLSDWVIACDGANSTIREKCHISFPGENITEQFVVADAQMSSSLPTNEIHFFLDKGTIFPDKNTIFAAFPWGSNKYRLSANLYLSHPRKFFTESEVKEIVAERTYGNYIVEKVSWISPFWIHSKLVDKMKDETIFLVGDAAHIHSSIGGQGMNTGMQDAYNLAWKLALVIQKKAKVSLLDSYHQERHPVIKELVAETEKITKNMLYNKSFFKNLIGFSKKGLPKHKSQKMASELTELSICYHQSSIIEYQKNKSSGFLQPGERMPDLIANNGNTLYSHLRNTYHNLLLFTGELIDNHLSMTIKKLELLTNQKFLGLLHLVIISVHPVKDVANQIEDEKKYLHTYFKIANRHIFLLRPDNYIAYQSAKVDIEPIEKCLERYLQCTD